MLNGVACLVCGHAQCSQRAAAVHVLRQPQDLVERVIVIRQKAVGRLDAYAAHAAVTDQLGCGLGTGHPAARRHFGVVFERALDLELRPQTERQPRQSKQ